MLSDVATFEVYASGLAVMPEAASISAAPRVTVAHAAPEVAPLPQYWKLPEAAVATKRKCTVGVERQGAAVNTAGRDLDARNIDVVGDQALAWIQHGERLH